MCGRAFASATARLCVRLCGPACTLESRSFTPRNSARARASGPTRRRRQRRRAYLRELRKEMRSARSASFLRPANTILVPGMYCHAPRESVSRAATLWRSWAQCTRHGRRRVEQGAGRGGEWRGGWVAYLLRVLEIHLEVLVRPDDARVLVGRRVREAGHLRGAVRRAFRRRHRGAAHLGQWFNGRGGGDGAEVAPKTGRRRLGVPAV